MNYLNTGGSFVKFYKYKNQLLIFYLAVGFFVGILYENIVSRRYGLSIDIFQTYFLQQYKQTEIVAEKYLGYVMKARVVPLMGLCVLTCVKWKKLLAIVNVCWTGFLAGVLMVSAVMQLGMKGILFCVVAMFPHIICYGLAYGILLSYLYRYPKASWNHAKTVFVVLVMFAGVLLETYLNPLLMKLVIGIM